jgi:hypothetical protein
LLQVNSSETKPGRFANAKGAGFCLPHKQV